MQKKIIGTTVFADSPLSERQVISIKDIPPTLLDVVMLSGILKANQKIGLTFNFDKQVDLTKFMQCAGPQK